MNLKMFYMAMFVFVISLSKIFAEMEESPWPEVAYFYFNKHSFICFNGNQYIHDPDCKCCQKFEGALQVKKHLYPITLHSTCSLKDND